MAGARLTRRFFTRSAETVARALIGAHLFHGHRRGVVIETEAYLGRHDLASHARFVSSKRNRVMFAAGGTAYVYLCYGIHQLFNVVTGHAGEPQAVLIRALADLVEPSSRRMSGPGKLTSVLGIAPDHNELDLTSASSEIGFARGSRIARGQIIATPRIGVDHAGEWAKAPLRFCLADHPAISG